jgi:hypothetical protein
MRLRQIALVAENLSTVSPAIADVFGLGTPWADPGVGKYGLSNAVFVVGDTFLEVVSPHREGTTAGRLLTKRGGDGGYMVILQTEDLAAARARVKEAGVRIVDQFDGDGVAFTHLHPKDLGGAILSIDAMIPKERWEWGGPSWREAVRTDVSVAIVGAELQGPDPEAMASRWGRVLGLAPEAHDGGFRLLLREGGLRFVKAEDGRGVCLGAFDVAVRSPEEVRRRAGARGLLDSHGCILAAGTRVRLLQA